MNILIKGSKILDKSSPHHGKSINVLIKNGKIAEIGKDNFKADKTIEAKGMYLTPGWFDMRAFFADPGFEHKEDLISGADAAAAGGFTGVAVLPNNKPITQSKNDISYIKSKSTGLVDLYPIAAVSIDAKGEELTEMIDLYHAGAVAFSDGLNPIWHTDILLKSLQYLQKFNGLLINRPEDIHLNLFGVMHEGKNSTMLGMKGMPSLAEELIVERDLKVLEYAGGRLHFSNVSSEESLRLIKAAKKKGFAVTCDVAAYQASFDDSDLQDFDTNFKVNPPFREKSDIKAIHKALKDGTVDVIVSSHIPQDEESKKLEFDLADFGITSLQTVAHNLVALSKFVEIEDLIDKLTINPRNLLGLDQAVIKKGEHVNLTLLDPKKKWTLNNATNHSRSRNSPFWEKELTGKAVAVFKGAIHKLSQDFQNG